MNDSVGVTRNVLEAMLAEARSEPLRECCGLLAGTNRIISAVLRARNALQSATAYEIAPVELFELFRRMRTQGLEHLGIYHSHPRGENAPSSLDIERAYYPEAAYFIVSPARDALQPVRAFRMGAGEWRELRIEAV